MSRISLTDVQATNLYQLQTICLALSRDKLDASRHFELSNAQADYLANLSADRLWAIVADVGEQSLFPPRHDLITLLQHPAPLTAPLAACSSPVPRRPAPR